MEVAELLRAVSQYEDAVARSLCLNAARNVISPGALALLGSRLVDGDLSGRHDEWGAQPNAAPARAVETLARECVGQLFGVPYAELRAFSCTMANGLALAALTRPGDTILAPPVWAFGHKSLGPMGHAGIHGLRVLEIPWDGAALGPDLDGLRRMIRQEQPRMVALGVSRPLFPEPLAEVAAMAAEVNALLMYDAAHVLGLVAGGAFPNPLAHGFAVVTGSTHKTFPGPMGGVVICRGSAELAAVAGVADNWISAYGNSRVAAFAWSAAEMVRHGSAYAKKVVANAQVLGNALSAAGFSVVAASRGCTATHQVLLDLTDRFAPDELVHTLAAARILLNPPTRADRRLRGSQSDGWWVRLGTSAITRLGMGESEMKAIASVLARLLIHREDAAKVADSVAGLVDRFATVHYALP